MPAYLAREEDGFLQEFLLVVFAKVDMVVGCGGQGQDVVCGFELGDRDETDWGR